MGRRKSCDECWPERVVEVRYFDRSVAGGLEAADYAFRCTVNLGRMPQL